MRFDFHHWLDRTKAFNFPDLVTIANESARSGTGPAKHQVRLGNERGWRHLMIVVSAALPMVKVAYSNRNMHVRTCDCVNRMTAQRMKGGK